MRGGKSRSNRDLADQALFLYDYSRYVHDHSVSRFARIDQKAAGFLSTVVIVIGIVFGLGSEWIYADFTDLEHVVFSALSWALGTVAVICAAFAIVQAFRAMQVSIVDTPPLSEDTIDYILKESVTDSRAGAAQTLLEVHNSLTDEMDRKGHHLARCARWTIGLLASSALAFTVAMVRSVIL